MAKKTTVKKTVTRINSATRREQSDKTHLAAPGQIAIATTTHLFTGEVMTVERAQRQDNDPFVRVILVHFETGDIGCLCMYSERRAKWAACQHRKLEYRTLNKVEGFEHDFGALVEVVDVEIVNKYKTKEQVEVKVKETPETAQTPENVFTSRNAARKYAKSLGIPQSRAKKDENGAWVVENTQ